jgi:hypothetical protein
MQISTNLLIDDLLQVTEKASASVTNFRQLYSTVLNYKASPEAWSVLECIEHLNLYGDFYLPEIEKQILTTRECRPVPVFKAGLIGNYFANLMQVKNGKIKKMKTPKDKNPANSALTITTIDRFLKQQELLKTLLNQARTVDLNKVKTAISLTNMIKLKLGDTFRFVIYHIDRHVQQAERAANN